MGINGSPTELKSKISTLYIPCAILLLGMALYLHGFIQTLPYQLGPDEPQIHRLALHLLTTGRLLNSYPPLRIAELTLEYRLLDLVTPGDVAQPIYFVFGRYFSTLYGVLLLAFSYRAGRSLHSPAAGWAVALFLLAQPDTVQMAKLNKVDVFAWLFGMITCLLSFVAIFRHKPQLIWLAMLVGLASVSGKYTMLPILILPGLSLIFLVPRKPAAKAALAILAVIIIAISAWLFFKPPATLLNYFPAHLKVLYERDQLIAFVSLQSAWSALMEQIGIINFWGVIFILPFAILVYPRERLVNKQWVVVGLLILVMVGTYLMMGLFEKNRAQDRYLIVLIFSLLWGLTLAMLTRRLPAATLVIAGVLLTPWLVTGWKYGDEIRLPDTRALTAEWFIENAPEGTHIAAEKDFVEFDRSYGGFPSEKIFFLEELDSVYDRSLESFARSGIDYLIADYRNVYRGGFFDPTRDNTEFLSEVETVLDLDVPWDRGWQGPARYVFRVPPIQQNPMHIFLGDSVIFKGYDLGSNAVAPGETLELTLYWEALREMDANYIVFAHLNDAEGNLVAQLDGPPGDAEHRTYDWWPGYFDWDEWPVTVPAEVESGTYTLVVGMYDADTVVRLPAVDVDGTPLGDSIILTEIVVEE